MELAHLLSLKTAVPYLRLFRNQLFVIKLGGEAVADRRQLDSILEQLMMLHQLGIRLILVHGGGAQATELGGKLGIESEFIDGRRVTSPAMIDALVMALNGQVRTEILSRCRVQKLDAIGLSGIDAGLVIATKRAPVKTSTGEKVNYGQVGDIHGIDTRPLTAILEAGMVPVVSSLACDETGVVLNINADLVAASIAIAAEAAKLVLVTKPRGVLEDVARPETLISQLSLGEMDALTASGVIRGGMLPKLTAAKRALEGGVDRVHVISSEYPDSVLAELFTNEGCGTMICND